MVLIVSLTFCNPRS